MRHHTSLNGSIRRVFWHFSLELRMEFQSGNSDSLAGKIIYGRLFIWTFLHQLHHDKTAPQVVEIFTKLYFRIRILTIFQKNSNPEIAKAQRVKLSIVCDLSDIFIVTSQCQTAPQVVEIFHFIFPD